MAMNFPSSPTVGQQWPSPPTAGYPVYRWDGTVWSSLGVQPGKMPVYTDGSTPMTAQLTLVGDCINPTDAADKHYVDSSISSSIATNAALKLNVAGGQTITGGFAVTPYNQAAGSFTPNPFNGNYQYFNNSAAFTLSAPSQDCGIDLLMTNITGAGAVTFSGFTVGANTGDALTTTVGSRFLISIRRINAISTYVIKALQ
jgi:hypothetical protein